MRVVDLFSGCGGMSLGFTNAGFNVVAAFDNWNPAIKIYQRNFSHPILKRDLLDVGARVEEIASLLPDMIIGGPPCQDFSSAGKRNEGGGRANLTVAFAEIVKHVGPQWFVMENVARAAKSQAYLRSRAVFVEGGYGLTEEVLDASVCGVPQKRKRFFVIGHLGGDDGELLEMLHARMACKQMTLRDYFGDSLGIEHYYRHPRSYKRRAVFSIDEPSPTIRGVNRPIPDGYPGHPSDTLPIENVARPLTTDERARVQTFPPNFVFCGAKASIEQAIGNAVPVKLAEFVAETIKCIKQGDSL
jgi:DNA (cytosine-5)-methyltransferase 1